MPSAVLDSTVLVSAFLTRGGVAGELLRYAREGAFTLFLSPEILDKHKGTDDERRHRRRYPYTDEEALAFCERLRIAASIVTALPDMTGAVPRDPNDDMVIATALEARVAYIITRDLDLLSLETYEHITIVTPEAFMALLRERETRPPTDPETGETL